jgi:hypothetical protein
MVPASQIETVVTDDTGLAEVAGPAVLVALQVAMEIPASMAGRVPGV